MPRDNTSAQVTTPRDRSKVEVWADRLLRFRGANISISQFCRDENVSLQAIYYWRRRIDSVSARLMHTTCQSEDRRGQRQSIDHEVSRKRSPPGDATGTQRHSRPNLVQRDSRGSLLQSGSRVTVLQRDSGDSFLQSGSRVNVLHRHSSGSLLQCGPGGSLLQRDPRDSLVRFTIEARGIWIECQSESPQAILAVLDWATSQPTSGFVIARVWSQDHRLTAGPEQIWRGKLGSDWTMLDAKFASARA